MRVLENYEWPGNVRELANLIERLVVVSPSGIVAAADLPWPLIDSTDSPIDSSIDSSIDTPEVLSARLSSAGGTVKTLPEGGIDLKAYLAQTERGMIEGALVEANGVVQQAAKLLGIGRTTLVEKIRRHKLQT